MSVSSKTTSRRGSASRASTSSLSDSEDAITPCPAETAQLPQQEQQGQPGQHASRRRSWRISQAYLDPVDADDVDAESLWRRMLTVQKIFGCYNSARMRAALDMGVESVFVRKSPGVVEPESMSPTDIPLSLQDMPAPLERQP